MKTFTIVAALVGVVSAFPASLPRDPAVHARAAQLARRANLTTDPLGVSQAQTNCGPTPCLTFDESQLVSVTGDHAYASPAADEIRGPCPGLNAAANHGYLPRSGTASIEETVSGLGAAYGMSPELAVALAAYAITIDGNIVEGLWSIGGPLPVDDITSDLLGDGQGLSYSHNNYEGDASIGRSDAYINNGDAHSLNITKFEAVYAVGQPDDRYTLDIFRQHFGAVQQESIANNPYFFTGAFSTIVVVPAAYNFVINFMSNHTAEEPSGYFDGNQFKQFFGVSGEPGSFVWERGQERIPEQWYKRPDSNQYTAPDVFEDVLIGYLAYPDTLLIGGNTGKTNSFLGVSLENFSEGKYAVDNLAEGDNFACFATEILQQGLPNALDLAVNDTASYSSYLSNNLANITDGLSCGQIAQYDFTLFETYPGHSYSPSGPDTNYKA